MKILILVSMTLLSLSALGSSIYSNDSFGPQEQKVLKAMTSTETHHMNTCVKESQEEAENDPETYELDFFEATTYCINEVLGDIHN